MSLIELLLSQSRTWCEGIFFFPYVVLFCLTASHPSMADNNVIGNQIMTLPYDTIGLKNIAQCARSLFIVYRHSFCLWLIATLYGLSQSCPAVGYYIKKKKKKKGGGAMDGHHYGPLLKGPHWVDHLTNKNVYRIMTLIYDTLWLEIIAKWARNVYENRSLLGSPNIYHLPSR